MATNPRQARDWTRVPDAPFPFPSFDNTTPYFDMENALQETELEDDVVGSGVFSDGPNTHVGEGSFESTWGMPGYAAREPGTGYSEVVDQRYGFPITVITPGMMELPNKWTTRQPNPIEERQGPNWVNGIDVLRHDAPRAVPIWNGLDEGVHRVRRRYASLDGLGDATDTASPSASLWQWAAAGLVAGVAVALVAGTLKMGGAR